MSNTHESEKFTYPEDIQEKYDEKVILASEHALNSILETFGDEIEDFVDPTLSMPDGVVARRRKELIDIMSAGILRSSIVTRKLMMPSNESDAETSPHTELPLDDTERPRGSHADIQMAHHRVAVRLGDVMAQDRDSIAPDYE